MTKKQKAIAEAFSNHAKWTGGALVVKYKNGDHQAIPGAYLSDISYTGSKEVVYSRREISDSEWEEFQAWCKKKNKAIPSKLSEASPNDYAEFAS